MASGYLEALSSRVIRAVEAVLPKDFRGKITLGQIDNGLVQRGTVAVEYRDQQPKLRRT